MAKRNTSTFLPKVYQSDKNKKFLSATLDQLMSSANLSRINGYVGRQFSPSFKKSDNYLTSTGKRTNYQLEPAVVSDNENTVVTFDDFLHFLENNGVSTADQNKLFNQEFYNWAGFIDFDKIVNFNSYYYLENGPDVVNVSGGDIPLQKTFDVNYNEENNNYNVSGTTGDNPIIYIARTGTYTFNTNQLDSQWFIQTEPGLSGFQTSTKTKSSREIHGVTNNGGTNGTDGLSTYGGITFTVPLATAQDGFDGYNVENIDLISDVPYKDVQGRSIDSLVEKFGGIDGQRNLLNKKVLFLQDSNDATDNTNWTFTADYDIAPWDRLNFQQENGTVATEDRLGIFQIQEVGGIIVLAKIDKLTYDKKLFVQEGNTYAGREFYRNTDTTKATIIPVKTANLDTLYYQNANDPKAFGIIKIVEQETETISAEDFLGKETYTSPNNVQFTNGLKIQFDSTIKEPVYRNKTYYVEGVGKKIHLVDTQLPTPEMTLEGKDYITIARGSVDFNAWSRSNRWFHKDVITATAGYNKVNTVIDENSRANRPIIEFNSGIELFDHATKGIEGVKLITTTDKDILTDINGSSGYFVDGVQLQAGDKIVTINDNDVQTRQTIWTVGYVDLDADSVPETIVLEDSGISISVGDGVYATHGTNNKGASYYWAGSKWEVSQRKTTKNQNPIFAMFDGNGTNFKDYTANNWTGNNLFTYKQGTGSKDSEIGIPLTYRTFNNVGDIVFENNYITSSFTHGEPVKTQNTSTGVVKVRDPYDSTVSYSNGWEKGTRNSRQLQEVIYTVSDATVKSYEIGQSPLSSTDILRNIFVYVNNKKTTNFTTGVTQGKNVVTLNDTLSVDDQIVVRFTTSIPTTKGYYTVPGNLERNANNEKFETITLGQLQNHIQALVDSHKMFTGSLQGSNNLRDIGTAKQTEGTILQHSSSLITSMLLSQYNELNYIDSVRYAGNEYEKFKSRFVNAVETLDGLDLTDPVDTVDKIIENINSNKSSTMPFYSSDMVPFGADNETITITVTDNRTKTYEIAQVFNDKVPSARAVLVYKNDVQLYKDIDFSFDTTASITFKETYNLAIGDVIKIVDYNNTNSNYIPTTPTKLGLYPKYKPCIELDNTYDIEQTVITGHDGSKTIAYGDARDNVILELEKRIYNNIKTDYDDNVFDIKKTLPGKFRTTDFNTANVNSILEDEFLRWTTVHRIPYSENNTFDANKKFTWNYKNFIDKLDKTLLSGGWRSIYNFYYDTYRPHTHAWEMFGWSVKPSWWEERYGVAPYTSGNKVLWDDVQNGYRYTSTTEYTEVATYKRANIYDYIPVNAYGELLPPIDSISVNSEDLSPSHNWIYGDEGPAEHAWKTSSSYPYAVQMLLSLLKPAEYQSQLFNKSLIVRSKILDQLVHLNTNQRITTTDLNVPSATVRLEGTANFVADYLRWQNIDTTTSLYNVIQKSTVQLAHKIEGYTDKKLIQVLAEQVSPSSTSSTVFVPDEDYSIHLHKTGPVLNIPYSGVIVQLTPSGYSVFGYDLTNPRFTIATPIETGNFNVHDVSGETINQYTEYTNVVKSIPYGHTFRTKQEVATFLFSYERWLKAQGYDFDNRMEDFGTVKITANWLMSVKEFVHWTKQGWADGTVISLSPTANRIRCSTTKGVVDSLLNRQTSVNVLNQNYEPLRPNTYKMMRADNEFELYPNPDAGGIYFANTRIVEYEHVLVFKNKTKFNDIIFEPALGSRQFRLKLVGYKTGNWDGSLTAQGFIYNDGVVPVWVANTDYVRGDIVKFKEQNYTASSNHTSSDIFEYSKWTKTDSFKIGLLPNFDTLGKNFQSFYDIDAVNLESETDKYGKGAIGYQARDYFSQIGLDDVSQVKFYQGMLKQKGTKSAVDKLVRSKFDTISSDVQFYEEWAIRTGSYGANTINNRVELELDEAGFTDNPQILKTVKSVEEKTLGSKTEYTVEDFYKKPADINYDFIPTQKSLQFGHTSEQFHDKLLPNVGYPKLTDADATLFNSKDAQTLTPFLGDMKIGYTVWVANDGTNEWDILYLDNTKIIVTGNDGSVDGSTYTWTTSTPHNFMPGDIVAIRGYTNKRDGVYNIQQINSPTEFVTGGSKEVGKESGVALVMKFTSIRFKTGTDTTTPRVGWNKGDKFYIDNDGTGNWKVLEKVNSYKSTQSIALDPGTADTTFGDSVCAQRNNQYVVIGQASTNKIHVYTPQPLDLKPFMVIQSKVTDVAEFGKSVTTGQFNPRKVMGKYEDWYAPFEWVAVGAPGTNSQKGLVTFFYKDPKSGSLTSQVLHQPGELSTGDRFGEKVKMSANGKWCLVTAPGKKKVYIYAIQNYDSYTQNLRGDGSTTAFVLQSDFENAGSSEQIYVRQGGTDLVASRDYTWDNATQTITFTTAPGNNVDLVVRTMTTWRLVDTITGTTDGFASAVSIDSNGKIIAISNPNESVVGEDSTTRMGAVNLYYRHYQNFVADGATKEFTLDTAGTGVFNHADPVFVDSVKRIAIEDSTVFYTQSSSTPKITFANKVPKGSTVTIFTNQFRHLQTIAPKFPQAEGNFGSTAIELNEDGDTLFVGVPEVSGAVDKSGIVEIHRRKDNQMYGRWIHELDPSSYNLGEPFYVNGYKITTTGTTSGTLIDDINNANIPFVDAIESGGKVHIRSKTYKPVFVAPGTSGTLFNDLVSEYIGGSDDKATKIQLTEYTTDGHKFGEALALSRDGETLIVGCPNGSTFVKTTFDQDQTLLDGGATRLITEKYRTGSVHIYQQVGTGYIEGDSLYTSSLDSRDKFGSAVTIANGTIYVSSPFDDQDTSTVDTGRLIRFETTGQIYNVSEQQQDLVDVDRINKVFLYNKSTNEIIRYLDYIDPIKGKVPGEAEQNIDFKTQWDPAVYNVSTDDVNVNNSEAYWRPEAHLGQIWWDLSQLRYIQYEQGSADYRSTFWGSVFPGSNISIYQWVESDTPPSNSSFVTKHDDNAYVEISKVNPKTGKLETKYYFWATNVREIHDSKTKSTGQIRSLIIDPVTNGLSYCQFTGKDTLSIVNCTDLLSDKNVVLSIDYDRKANDKLLHNEWQLVQEGNPKGVLPQDIYNKMKDSLVGADDRGNLVPDISLSLGDRYGIDIRPRQTMFVNRYNALKEFVDYVNNVVKEKNVVKSIRFDNLNKEDPMPTKIDKLWDQKVANELELSYINKNITQAGWRVLVETDNNIDGRWTIQTLQEDKTWKANRIQSYDTKKFWKYIDWYATGYSKDTFINHRYEEFNSVYSNAIDNNAIIKINNGGNWDLYCKKSTGYTLVGQKNGTIELKPELHDYSTYRFGFDMEGFDYELLDTEPQIETRNIIDAVRNDIFINNLEVEMNKLIFAMMRFVLKEQPFVDWLFKTSFITLNHNLRALDQFAVYQRDNQEFVNNYINEVKPYHTKVREYVLGYSKQETYDGDATDFDKPAYYDEVTQTFRSPNYEQGHDKATIETNNNYKMWRENHSYIVDSLRRSRFGIGYVTPPTITIEEPKDKLGNVIEGGVRATATCTIVGGQVNTITMTNKGSGYVKAPTVTVSGGGFTAEAILHPVLKNETIRKIKETIKLDRVRFSSSVKQWKQNTSYTVGDVIQFNNEAYVVNTAFTSGSTFDSTYMTVKLDNTFDNAMDRTMAYYKPYGNVEEEDYKEKLGMVFKGITYPGTKVQGPLFSEDPGFDKGLFDSRDFDNFEIDSDGRYIISSSALDTKLQSKFEDSLLGTRPADITTGGGAFVDAYSSHAPEEFVPGRVFDTLNMNVFTAPSRDSDDDGALGMPIIAYNYQGDGVETTYKYSDNKQFTQKVLVYSKTNGYLTNFTINQDSGQIIFATPPANGEIFNVTSFGVTGDKMIFDYKTGIGSTVNNVNIPIAFDQVDNRQMLIFVNNQIAGSVTASADGSQTKLTFAGNLVSGDNVQVYIFDVNSTANRTFSIVTVDTFNVNDSTRTFTLSDGSNFDLSRTDKVIVELNDNRLRPPVFNYYISDGSTTVYDITDDADVNHATLTKSDTKVFIDGVETTAYTITQGSDSTIKAINLNTAATSKAKIDIAVLTNADYNFNSATELVITGGTFTGSDSLRVTTFNNHNLEKITTQTFKGSQQVSISTQIGYDDRAFDSLGFDSTTTTIINVAEYTGFRTPNSVNYLWVTLNGVRQIANLDYSIQGDKITFASTINATDIIMITHFTEETIKPAVGFKILQDILGNKKYYRLSRLDSTELAKAVTKKSRKIHLKDASVLPTPDPSQNLYGVVDVDGERIEYLAINVIDNTISRLRRGTMGTSIKEHGVNTSVIDISERQEIPNPDAKTWYKLTDSAPSDGLGLQNAGTIQSNFLLEKPTFIKT